MGMHKNARLDKQDASRAKAEKRASSFVEFKGFVNIALSDAQRENFTQWLAQEGVFDESLDSLIADMGYKISVKWSEKEGCFMAMAYCEKVGHQSAGYMLTERSVNPMRAIAKAVYIVYYLCAGDIAKHSVKTEKFFENW